MNGNTFLNSIIPGSSYDEERNPWFLSYTTGIFGNVDWENKIVNAASCVGMERRIGCSDFIDLVSTEEQLFFVPSYICDDFVVGVFNIQTREYSTIPLRKSKVANEHTDDLTFVRGIRIEEYVYLIPSAYDAVVRININSHEIDYIDDWFRIFEEKINDTENPLYYGFVSRQYVIKDNNLYLPFASINAILKINIRTLITEIVFLKIYSSGFSCICDYGKNRFLLSGCGNNPNWLYIWDESDNAIIDVIKLQENSSSLPVLGIIGDRESNYYIFPWKNINKEYLDVYKLDNGNHLNNTNLLRGGWEASPSHMYYMFEVLFISGMTKDGVIRFVSGRDLKWHEYDVNIKTHSTYNMEIDWKNPKNAEVLIKYYKQFVNKEIPIHEREINLQRFIQDII